MAKKWEWPNDPGTLVYTEGYTGRHRWIGESRPTTDLEGMMCLAPHQTQCLPSLESQSELKELLGIVIDNLEPEDRWIFQALIIEGMSLRVTGRVLGIPKTSLARRRDRIKKQLMLQLVDHSVVQQWLNHVW